MHDPTTSENFGMQARIREAQRVNMSGDEKRTSTCLELRKRNFENFQS